MNKNILPIKNVHALLAAIAAVPIWLAIDTYLNVIHAHLDEAAATAATGVLLIGVFIGRHLAELWSASRRAISNSILIAISGVIFVSVVWLFSNAGGLFEGHEALRLLLNWVSFVTMSVATGTLIKLVRIIGADKLKAAETLAAQSKSELHLLQSQLSPHFLFNTLNNLYGLSITQHERIPPLLLKLSDLLRYSVYEANALFVPLKDELVYIDNYIEFEKIRLGERLVLTTNLEQINDPNIKIAPMLLIVFIENAFKHSKNTADAHIYIHMELKIWQNLILFSIKNSHKKQKEEERIMDKNSGFGLASVNKRLELLYPNEHELTVENQDTDYHVVLRLKVK